MANRQTDKVLFFGDAVTDVRTSAQGVGPVPLGTKREEEGKTYRWVQLDAGATAAVVGQMLYHVGGGGSEWIVTKTAANTAPNLGCGVCVAAPAASGYCWMQTRGRYNGVAADAAGTIAKGDFLIEALATDGKFREQIVATADTAAAVLVQTKLLKPVALALQAEAAGVVDVMLIFE